MSKLIVKLADCPEEIEQAFRLRYQVFVEEENIAHMRNDTGIEQDEYDEYCEHLIVRDEEKDLVVGVYRMLPGHRVKEKGIYTCTEFDLTGFREQLPRALEIGRTCVHPDYRESKTMLLLWNGMLGYFGRDEFTYLMGCASVRADDPSELNALYSYFCQKSYTIDRYQIAPLPSHRVENLHYVGEVDEKTAFGKLPPMIKGYLRLGSEIVREPAYDPIFNTYDFCMILTKDQMSPKYQRHFIDSKL
ncbi:MAG: GNAT family N-acetyltransferase [Paenibacillaceae bacterium]|nr:GNAT family N-acetyltransferase [Paenibacillaceae bacterium]